MPNCLRVFPVVLMMVGLVGCGEEGVDCSDPDVECDDHGATFYYLNNLSTHDLTVKLKYVSQPSEYPESVDAPAGQRVKIGEDGGIGLNPRPTHTFAEISLWASQTPGADSVQVWAQDPISDEAWTQDSYSGGLYGLSEYSLTVTDSDLVF